MIQAALPQTRAFRLTARVRRDRPVWRLTELAGTIGRSVGHGHLEIRPAGGRGRIDGALRFDRLDFADLASPAALAEGAARRARLGPRTIPGTWIRLDHLRLLDLALTLRAERLIGDVAPLTGLAATVRLDRSVLRLDARIRLSAPLLVGGSFARPRADAAPRASSLGGILKTIGGVFDPGPVAQDTDCANLKAHVMR